MPWSTRNRPRRWASILFFLPWCLILFFRRNKCAAGVRMSASSVAATGAASADVPGVAAEGSYGRFSSPADAPSYPVQRIHVLQPQWWKRGEPPQPLGQRQQQLQNQPKHLYIQSLQQQQQQTYQVTQGHLNNRPSGPAPRSAATQLPDTPLELLSNSQAFFYPQRVPLLSHVQQQQRLDGETSQLKPLQQQEEETQKLKQQPVPATHPLRPVNQHYTHRIPSSDEVSSAPQPGALPTLVDLGKSGGQASVDHEMNEGTGVPGNELPAMSTATSLELPTLDRSTSQEHQLQRWEDQGSLHQTGVQQQPEDGGVPKQSQPVPQPAQHDQTFPETEEEGLRIPFFPALPEALWSYKEHGRDWKGLCAEGRRQSPVDLHIEGLHERQYRNLTAMYRDAFAGVHADLYTSVLSARRPWRRGDFFYFYPNSFPTLQVYRSSKVFQLRAANGSMTALGALFPTDAAEMLTAQHIFFHSPSEHTFQGEANRREVEMQIWHFSDDPITFRASTGVNRTTLPYLALFAEGSLGLPAATIAEEEGVSAREPFSNTMQQSEHAAATAAPPGTFSDHEGRATQGREAETETGTSDREAAKALAEAATGEEQGKDGAPLKESGGSSGGREAFSAAEMRATARQTSAAAAAGRAPETGALEGTPGTAKTGNEWNRNDSGGNGAPGNLLSPTAHWRVVSLTFMSEELDQATVKDLKSLPSERLISTLLQAEMVNATGKPGGETIRLNEPLNLQALMMMLQLSNTEFFAYDGSSTMPSCDENVRWYVARQPLPVATETMLRFYKMLNPAPVVSPSEKDGNFRSLQNVELGQMRNEGNVYLVQGFPLQLLVAASLGFEAMARLPRGEAPALQKFFGLSPSSVTSAAGPPRHLLPTYAAATLFLILLSTLTAAGILEASV